MVESMMSDNHPIFSNRSEMSILVLLIPWMRMRIHVMVATKVDII